MSLVYFLVQQMMLFSIPLLIVALGGMFCERSGVINIALEGIMVLGGFTGILFINLFQGVLPGQPILLIALVISMVTGMLISLVHAYASINMKANQSISGTAINMFAPAFAIFVARVIRNVQQIPFENQFRIEKVRKSHVEVNYRLLQLNRIIFFKPSIPAGFLRHCKQWFEVFTRV